MENKNPSLISGMQEQITNEILHTLDNYLEGYPAQYRDMIDYQLGLGGKNPNKQAQGKRLRPLFVLMACYAFGGDWHAALPAASAVELMHNFSLVHDDIQDASETRRGRDTIWKKWGIAQAINIGDALLNLSFLSINRTKDFIDPLVPNDMLHILEHTCLVLTKGQYLDLAYENESQIPVDLYWQMIGGKTAELLGTSLQLGAMITDASKPDLDKLFNLGYDLGLAFQVQDDFLGIWGESGITGKSNYTDLKSRKKTLPILLGLENNLRFAELWQQSKNIDEQKAKILAQEMEKEGINEKVVSKFTELYDTAGSSLHDFNLKEDLVEPLIEVIDSLRFRTK